ncbi:BTB/POZ domain-containing protein At1g63850 isoform X2 [Cryptomeria japonica]|uniref:BTB/POZ domain-containing protein At1g63850 isoform X2 n=1 Tax=Cryptomeria japonica TaxID=3369 RepID=UPI0025AC4908|nr:BTB/POZ domain-containing protein At1g63850 isoform X2 [Cryptomeria japonica]
MEDEVAAMDTHSFETGDGNGGDVILRLICSDGVEYEGNPLHLHSHVLNKSKFFQARLSERWSLHSSSPEIKLAVLPNRVAENYIKCIRLMYSSYKGTCLYFSGVDEALDIFPVASELLFEEGIQACMHYLEAVPWTPKQSHKINSLLSSSQVSVSSDLSARFGIPNSLFNKELELLRKKLPEMFSIMWGNKSHKIPQSSMRLTIVQYLIENFQDNKYPAMQEWTGT